MSFNPHGYFSPIKSTSPGVEKMNIDVSSDESTDSTPDSNSLSDRSPISILRSSSLYTGKESIHERKRVSIVSPCNWDCKLQRREFIHTTIPYCDIKNILRSMGCYVSGTYNACVNQLVASNWIPNQKYILYNQKLRAKPIFHENERIINLECGDIEYLKQFSLNQLKKWLKYNNIKQAKHINKYQCMELINKTYTYLSPAPCKIRFKLPPKTPKTLKKYDQRDDNMEGLLKQFNGCEDTELNDIKDLNDVYGTIRKLSFDDIDY